IDAKKGKVYACLFNRPHLTAPVKQGRLGRITDYMLADIESIFEKIKKPVLVFGDGAELYKEQCERNALVTISKKDWLPKAEVVAKLGLQEAKKRKFASPDKLVPMYLHSRYCQVK
ncbi:unnamed protein product, partial [marine sediment metagenome]